MNALENNHNDYRLLVIDDEIEVTKSIVRQFRKKYDVFSANSGEEALDIMEKMTFKSLFPISECQG